MEYKICNSIITVTISSLGGEPLGIEGADGTKYLWTGSKEYWPGSAPHLFPFIGRLYEERYIYDGVSYPLEIHGFLKSSEMETEEYGEDYLILSLNSNEETKRKYPFDFNLKIEYRLRESTLSIVFKVTNLDEKTMLFAIGGHPGFNVPLEKGLKFEDYILEFSEKATPKRAAPTPSNLMNGEFLNFPLKNGTRIPLDHGLFDADAIILKDVPRSVTLKSDKSQRAVRVDYPDFKYIGFWHTVKSDAPFVCIEPWTALQGYDGVVQQIEENEDMISLKTKEEYKNEWTITIIQ